MKYLVSICITSYKRIDELERCIKSVDSKYVDKIEVIVSEDKSPQREQIQAMVVDIAKTSPYHIHFNTNPENLGYDRNLKKLMTLAQGEYIFYMSDDDVIYPGVLDKLIDCIEKADNKPALIFSPFWYGPFHDLKRKYDESHVIPAGNESCIRYAYDAILFSGLIFRKDVIINLDAERFKNLNYFQVYMFLTVMFRHGAYYLDELMIDSVSDGENAYGGVTSSGTNSLLADRNSIFSNLEFNKGLFKAVQFFDTDCNANVFSAFAREYSNRTFGGLCRARRHGLKAYNEYWSKLKEAINLSPIAYAYYWFIAICGASLSSFVFAQIKKIVYHVRSKV